MSAAATASSAGPRLLRSLELAKPWLATSDSVRKNLDYWSPKEVLASFGSPSSSSPNNTKSLTVKQQPRRFFMYEEHGSSKLTSDIGGSPTNILQRSPLELAELLHQKSTTTSTTTSNIDPNYYYWTSPVADVAPQLLEERLQGFESLHPRSSRRRLDPRGPSLWMGSSGSVTQAHYDVADNVIVQLWGQKRIRIWPPTAAIHLHVFPDAHARARKSQVHFDDDDDANNTDLVASCRYPHFSSLPPPVLDCLLQPGDALSIPAFWFHHVENGSNGHGYNTDAEDEQLQQQQSLPNDNGIEQEPSVSLNMFALSESMMVAQDVFQAGSRPFGSPQSSSSKEDKIITTAEQLRVLAWELCSKLNLDPQMLIRTSLLDTRYVPLRDDSTSTITNNLNQPLVPPGRTTLTESEQKQVDQCMDRILPPFEWLVTHSDEGVLSLVACHLLELWAVEMVGADSVEAVWETVLQISAND